MAKSADNQEQNKEDIKRLLTAKEPPQANNNISKSSDLQGLFSEALVERIAEINQIKDKKERETALTKLSDNAASLLGQPKNYMKILVNDAARKMAKEYDIAVIESKLPYSKYIISEMRDMKAKDLNENQRSDWIKVITHNTQLFNKYPDKLQAQKFEELYNKYTTQPVRELSPKVRFGDEQWRDNTEEQLIREVISSSKDTKTMRGKYEIYTKLYDTKKSEHDEFIKTAINEIANKTISHKRGILSKISNEIKLLIAQINVTVRRKGNDAQKLGQSITTAKTNWSEKIKKEKEPKKSTEQQR